MWICTLSSFHENIGVLVSGFFLLLMGEESEQLMVIKKPASTSLPLLVPKRNLLPLYGCTMEPLIMDTLKSGQPPYNGHTVHPLPMYCPYIPTSEEGTTSEQWTKCSSPTCPLFGGSTLRRKAARRGERGGRREKQRERGGSPVRGGVRKGRSRGRMQAHKVLFIFLLSLPLFSRRWWLMS